MSARAPTHPDRFDDHARGAGGVYVLMLVVALAFAGFVWKLYESAETPRFEAEPGPYKVAYEGETVAGPESASPADSLEQPAGAVPAVQSIGAAGAFVAQLAALRSEEAVSAAWRRFEGRAPDLFSAAQLDVQRADLGARGVYYRVRAGYFASREEAARFCERIRELGQDCVPTAR